MRKGFDGLAALIQVELSESPFSGQLFVFRGRRGDRLKILWWDGDGLCLYAKRLERGRFVCGRERRTAACISPRRSCRCCSKGSIGDDRYARRRRNSRCD
jgi:transposase